MDMRSKKLLHSVGDEHEELRGIAIFSDVFISLPLHLTLVCCLQRSREEKGSKKCLAGPCLILREMIRTKHDMKL